MPYRFTGFSEPNYTQIPDIFFDEIMCQLTEAELRVALYIMRRTFGFKKRSDAISLSQMVNGITTRDGRVLDHGAGVQRAAASRAVHGLVDKGVIAIRHSQSPERGFETTTYQLHFSETMDLKDPEDGDPSIPKIPAPDIPKIPALVSERDPQKTVEQDLQCLQQTAASNSSNSSSPELMDNENKRRPRGRARQASQTPHLDAVIEELSEQFGDWTHRRSNVTQAQHIMDTYGVSEDELAEIFRQAAAQTRDRQGSIQRRMPYLFQLVRERAERHQEAHKPKSLAGKWANIVHR